MNPISNTPDNDRFIRELHTNTAFRDKVVSVALNVLSQPSSEGHPAESLLTQSIASIDPTLMDHEVEKIHLVAIFKFCAEQRIDLIASNIDKIKNLDEEARVQIAMKCAEISPLIVADSIDKFRIETEKSRIEIAQLCVKLNPKWMIYDIERFGIKDQQVLSEIAMVCAKQYAGLTAERIKNFGIVDESIRIEIAEACIEQDITQTLESFENFGIQNQQALIKIAKKCAEQDRVLTAKFIVYFGIQDQAAVMEVIKWCLPLRYQEWLRTVEDFPEVAKALHPLFILGFLLTDETDEGIKQFQSLNVLQECQKVYLPSSPVLEFLEEERLKCQSEPPSSVLSLRYARHALMALYVAKECERIGVNGLASCEPFLMVLFKLRGTDVPWKELMQLDYVLHEPSLLSRLQGQKVNAHERLIYLNYVAGSKNSSADQCASGWKQLKKKEGLLSELRHDVKQKDSGLLQQLLLTTSLLNDLPALSFEERYGLIWSGWKTPLELADRLRYLQILLAQGVFKEGIPQSWQFPISNQTLKDQVIQAAKEILLPKEISSEELKLFAEKYLEWTNTQRMSFALESYASKMRSLNDPLINRTLHLLIVHLLQGTFSAIRYSPLNPHIEELVIEHTDLWYNWQNLPPLRDDMLQNESVAPTLDWGEESRQWLHTALVQDQHVARDQLGALRCFLQGQAITGILTAIELLCQELCQKGISKQETEQKLQELLNLVEQDPHLKDSQWKRDIKDRLKMVKSEVKSAASVLIGISDEWNDLFLSGTEVIGSCQHIHGFASFNRCLLSYCMDGKIQMAVIKEKESGRIKARALIKLLFKKDPSGKDVPVLFFERVYSTPGFQHSAAALRSIALERARVLGIEIYEEGNQETLESLGSNAPYEYEDARGGVTQKGIYTIGARRME